MTNRLCTPVALALLVLSAVLVFAGKVQPDVSLESVARLWGDVLFDWDRAAGSAAPVAAVDEVRLGNRLAAQLSGSIRELPAESAYVTEVGTQLTRGVRRQSVPYRFVVVDSPQINAFSLPGGHVYITSGLLAFVGNEAELAAILGHEMAHVDLEHCVDRYRYQTALHGHAGESGAVIDILRQGSAAAWNQQQELDADSRGVQLAVTAGYHPKALEAAFVRLWALEAAPPGTPRTAEQEAVQSIAGLFRPYLESHPQSDERARALAAALARQHSQFAGRTYYLGVRNLHQRVSFRRQAFPEEWTAY